MIYRHACALLLLTILANRTSPDDLKKKIVVEQTQSNFEAERAGIQKGDVVLRWSRAEEHGEIESPFDLTVLEIEQEPRGLVTLEGLRSGEKLSWKLGPNSWRIKSRPDLAADILTEYLRGEDLAHAGKLTDAVKLWRGLADQVAGREPAWLASWVMLHAAESLTGPALAKDADDAYQQAVEFSASAGTPVRGQLFRTWALRCEQRGDLENAGKHFQQSLEAGQSNGQESLIVAENLNSLGRIAGRQGDGTRAERYLLQALAIRTKLAPESLPMATNLSNLGLLARRRGEPAKAEDLFRRALAIEEKLVPESLDITVILNNLGLLAEDRGDLKTARAHYSRILEIRQKLTPAGADVAGALNNLGNVAERLGDFENAQRYHTEALEIRKRLMPDSAEVAESYNGLGMLAVDRGDLVAAEKYHALALEIRTKRLSPASLDLAASLFNLGEVALARHDLARAEDYHRRALTIKEKQASGGVNLARSLARIALFAEGRGDFTTAEKYLQHAIQINREKAPDSLALAQNLNQAAYLAVKQKRRAQAQDCLSEALKTAQGVAPAGLNAAESLYLSGELARDRGEVAAAEVYYRQALEILTKLVPGSAQQAESLAALAKLLGQEHRSADAAQLFEKALNALESQTAILGGPEDVRLGFRADYSEYYSAYIDLLVADKKPELAFEVFERSRGRTLMEMLKAANLEIRKGVPPDLLQRERELREELAALTTLSLRAANGGQTEQPAAIKRDIEKLLADYQEIQSLIRAHGPDFAALTQPQPLSARAVQRELLDRKTVLLEYALGKSRSYVWAVTQDTLEWYELPGQARIEAAAMRFYRTTVSAEPRPSSRGEVATTEAGVAVSRMLLGPVAGRIAGKRLLIVSDGALQYIPFSALPSPEDLKQPGRRVVPLMVKHEIVNLPSASVLALVRQASTGRQPAPMTVAVLADPVFDVQDPRVSVRRASAEPASPIQLIPSVLTQGRLTRSPGELGWNHLARLPFSQREAAAILNVTPPGQGMGALGFEASRAKVTGGELSQYRFVHIATHGLLNTEHPEVSGLVLSLVDEQGQPQNGFLTLQDVYNLNLPVELVVLSGCETALGKEIRGEGLIGLTRGFMYAGATRVLASLWSVDDVATAELMAEFYKAMEQGSMTPAAALRQAEIKMWRQKRWRTPYYWAGFQLQGEWK